MNEKIQNDIDRFREKHILGIGENALKGMISSEEIAEIENIQE